MLRGTRENISFRALISNCAGVIALCFLLFASTVVIPQGNLHSALLPSAYAQQEEEEDETGTAEAQVSEEEDETGTAEAQVSEEEELEPESTDLTAVISANDTSGDAPLTVDFNATIAGGTEPYTISWDFGDGDIIEDSDEQSVVHTFDEAGTYTVALSVTDSEDQTVSDSIEVTVEEGEELEPEPESTDLTAVISANDTSGDAPLTVDFNATIAGGTEPYTISWDFGDGDIIEDS